MMFDSTTIRENDVALNNNSEKSRSVLRSFVNSTIRSNDFRQFFFFRQNNDSEKLHFGETTIRWNNVSEKWCGPVDRPSQRNINPEDWSNPRGSRKDIEGLICIIKEVQRIRVRLLYRGLKPQKEPRAILRGESNTRTLTAAKIQPTI